MNADSYGDALDCTLKEITKLHKTTSEQAEEITKLREQVAAQAAVIEKLREAIELAMNSYGVMLLSDPPQDAWKSRGVTQEIRKAIATQTDSTQILAEVRRAERERVITLLNARFGYLDDYDLHQMSKAIRAME